MRSVDVSLILTVHDERSFIQRTLKSLEASSRYAQSRGVTVELIMVLDRAHPSLLQHVQRYESDAYEKVSLLETDHGCPGPARNAGVAIARGKYVTMCDADDLISANMIESMYFCAITKEDNVLVVPEYSVCFGAEAFARKYFDLTKITPLAFLQYHPYNSRILTSRGTFDKIRYSNIGRGGPYAHEDWHFIAEAIGHGFGVVTAPDTVAFDRRRIGSRSAKAGQQSTNMVPRNPLFEPEKYISICCDYNSWLSGSVESRCAAQFDRSLIAATASRFFSSENYKSIVVAANKIEPEISVDAFVVSKLDFPRPDALVAGLGYLEICNVLVGKSFSDIFLMPSLSAGGSEKYMLEVMESITRESVASEILIICHDKSSPTDWTSRVPDGVTVVALDRLVATVTFDTALLLTHKILQMLAPRSRVHIQTSTFVFAFFHRGFHAALSDSFVIFYRFCDQRAFIEGKLLTCPNKFQFLSANLQSIDMIISDHPALIERDRETFGIDPEKWVCLSAYCTSRASQTQVVADLGRSNRRFLWASRLVGQKFPTMLVLISEILAYRNSSIIIDIYGSGGNAPDAVDPAIFEGCSNLCYQGPYSDFESIDKSLYDGFVYTTMFDGLPNVVLEAMASGLPIIAPNCDGLPDVVIDEVTGFLMPYGADYLAIAASYCTAMETLSSNPVLRTAMSERCLDLIEEKHSQAAHRRRVCEIFSLCAAGPNDPKSGGVSAYIAGEISTF